MIRTNSAQNPATFDRLKYPWNTKATHTTTLKREFFMNSLKVVCEVSRKLSQTLENSEATYSLKVKIGLPRIKFLNGLLDLIRGIFCF